MQLCILIFLFYFLFSKATSLTTSAASKFKVSSKNTSPELLKKWKREDSALFDYVNSKVPDVLNHTGSAAFDEHLVGVQSVLRFWNAADHVTAAGLFHSIYGSEGFQGFCLPLSERPKLQNLIGAKAEFLVWIFCMVDRYTVDKHVMEWEPGKKLKSSYTVRSRAETGGFEMTLNTEDFLDFIELTLADWLEQVEGASEKENPFFLWKVGEAYAYRRDQYYAMSKLLAHERAPRLSEIVPKMHRAVMETENIETRNLIQPRTPPVSKAAELAFEALRAAGEDIPKVLSPQPRGESCSVDVLRS